MRNASPRFGHIKSLSFFLGAVLVALILSVMISLSTNRVAYAWCDNLGISFEHLCVSENYDSLPGNIKSTTNIDDFREIANSCMESGNAYGIDYGIRQGGCADAATSCLRHIVDPEYCTGDVMASMVGGLFSEDSIFGGSCNDGKLTDNGDQDCSPLAKANKAAIDADTDAAVAIAKGACTVPTTGSEADKTIAAQACTKSIEEACTKPELNNNGTLKNDADYTSYKKCLSNALFDNAKDENECTGRGGKWTPKQGPALPGQGLGGACVAAPPTTPTDPCEGHGGTNAATGKCNDGTDPKEADCPKVPGTNTCATIGRVSDRCGEARVNIIVCGDEGGNVALNNVLKIVVMVLSITVGVAAVGGLAWAAVLYSKAEDNEGNVSEAKTLIQNIVIGLIAYVFLIALTNWLVPGSVIT